MTVRKRQNLLPIVTGGGGTLLPITASGGRTYAVGNGMRKKCTRQLHNRTHTLSGEGDIRQRLY
jgi:hypothetical protein